MKWQGAEIRRKKRLDHRRTKSSY